MRSVWVHFDEEVTTSKPGRNIWHIAPPCLRLEDVIISRIPIEMQFFGGPTKSCFFSAQAIAQVRDRITFADFGTDRTYFIRYEWGHTKSCPATTTMPITWHDWMAFMARFRCKIRFFFDKDCKGHYVGMNGPRSTCKSTYGYYITFRMLRAGGGGWKHGWAEFSYYIVYLQMLHRLANKLWPNISVLLLVTVCHLCLI